MENRYKWQKQFAFIRSFSPPFKCVEFLLFVLAREILVSLLSWEWNGSERRKMVKLRDRQRQTHCVWGMGWEKFVWWDVIWYFSYSQDFFLREKSLGRVKFRSSQVETSWKSYSIVILLYLLIVLPTEGGWLSRMHVEARKLSRVLKIDLSEQIKWVKGKFELFPSGFGWKTSRDIKWKKFFRFFFSALTFTLTLSQSRESLYSRARDNIVVGLWLSRGGERECWRIFHFTMPTTTRSWKWQKTNREMNFPRSSHQFKLSLVGVGGWDGLKFCMRRESFTCAFIFPELLSALQDGFKVHHLTPEWWWFHFSRRGILWWILLLPPCGILALFLLNVRLRSPEQPTKSRRRRSENSINFHIFFHVYCFFFQHNELRRTEWESSQQQYHTHKMSTRPKMMKLANCVLAILFSTRATHRLKMRSDAATWRNFESTSASRERERDLNRILLLAQMRFLRFFFVTFILFLSYVCFVLGCQIIWPWKGNKSTRQ